MGTFKNPSRSVWHTSICSRCNKVITRVQLPGLAKVTSYRICDKCLSEAGAAQGAAATAAAGGAASPGAAPARRPRGGGGTRGGGGARRGGRAPAAAATE